MIWEMNGRIVGGFRLKRLRVGHIVCVSLILIVYYSRLSAYKWTCANVCVSVLCPDRHHISTTDQKLHLEQPDLKQRVIDEGPCRKVAD